MNTIRLLAIVVIAPLAFSQEPDMKSNGQIHRLRGEEYIQLGDLTKAIEEYRKVSDDAENPDVVALKRLATLHQWTRHFSEAAGLLESILTINPLETEARNIWITPNHLMTSAHWRKLVDANSAFRYPLPLRSSTAVP